MEVVSAQFRPGWRTHYSPRNPLKEEHPGYHITKIGRRRNSLIAECVHKLSEILRK
jgi:hypothetical protein